MRLYRLRTYLERMAFLSQLQVQNGGDLQKKVYQGSEFQIQKISGIA